MALFNYDNLAANLPDVLAKDKNSNNYKLLNVIKLMRDRMDKIHEDIANSLDINKCTGATLDAWGKRYQVSRGTSTDEQYLLRIKAKMRQNCCDGTHDSIVSTLAFMLSCDKSKIKIKSGEASNTVDIVEIPLDVIIKTEFSTDQLTEIINRLLVAGVKLNAINYSGTFELGETWGETDDYSLAKENDKGLSDSMNGERGGYLGMTRR